LPGRLADPTGWSKPARDEVEPDPGVGEAIAGGGDWARIVEQARELVDVLPGLEEWDRGPGWMRPIQMVA
jgi:hypothetical protein